MGEYAMYGGAQIKIGTCESMYYLRADQAHKVTAEAGSVDPVMNRSEIRFRFPWPDEDNMAPGSFDNCDRSVAAYCVEVPADVEHSTIQLRHDAGYLVSLPCPESTEGKASPFKIHRNGFRGAVLVVQQKWVGAKLVTVCACGGCGARYRVETPADVKALADSFRREAEQRRRSEWISMRSDSREPTAAQKLTIERAGAFYETIAIRIEAGYDGRQASILEEYTAKIEERLAAARAKVAAHGG